MLCFFLISIFFKKKKTTNKKQHFLSICHPGSLSDALQLPHAAARHFLTASHLQGAPPQTLHGSLEWAKGASLCRCCVLGQCQLPLHASLLMSAPPNPSYTHFQIRHSFNPPSLPDKLPQRRSKPRNGEWPEPTFLHLATFSFYLFVFLVWTLFASPEI